MSPEQKAPLGNDWPQPSMYQKKGRLRDDPDLVEKFQQQAIAIAYLMEWYALKSFEIPANTARELRMSRVEVEVAESGEIFVRRES